MIISASQFYLSLKKHESNHDSVTFVGVCTNKCHMVSYIWRRRSVGQNIVNILDLTVVILLKILQFNLTQVSDSSPV